MDFTCVVIRPRWESSGLERFNDRNPLVITDPGIVKQLAGFFPGLGEGKCSRLAGGWGPGLRILFRVDSGREIQIHVDEGFHYWREREGDWPLDSRFQSFILRIVAENEPPAGMVEECV